MKTFPLKLLLITLTLAATSVFAAPPTPATLDALLAASGAQPALESTLNGVETRMRAEINRQLFTHNNGPVTAAQKAAIDKAAPQITKVMQEEMGWAKMKPAYAQIYQEALSQEEAARLLTLYKDPSYMALMQKLVTINQKSAQAIQAKLPVIQQKIEPILEKAVKEAIGEK
ncbi:MAG: DUF2059 domain-containing protein [Burkholderiaceae bacterium]